LRSLGLAIMTEKWKVIFWLDNGAYFSILLSFLVPGPMTRLSFRAYLASCSSASLPSLWPALGETSSYVIFCHSFLIFPEIVVPLLGWDLLSQLKAQILLPPGSYLCCPLLQEQIDLTVDWWDDCRESQDGPPYSNKTQKSLTVSTPKNDTPSSLREDRPYTCQKFLKNQGLLISCSNPYNTPTLAIREGTNGDWFKTSGSLMKQSFPSTQLFSIPIRYWLKYSQKPSITLS
jgi:hypothetical protein